MDVEQMLSSARDAITVRRVFGEPYEHDGVTVIPAARVSGGGGGGSGNDPNRGTGQGGGFGVQARPVGAYVLKDGAVRWTPAVDVNRVIGAAAAVLLGAMVTQVRWAKLHRKQLRGKKARGKRSRSAA